MVTVTVVRGFRDLKEHLDRVPGETFAATEERAAELAEKLPGYVTYEPEGEDLSSLTLADLRRLADERGVKLPKGATKAKIIEILGG